MWYELRFTSILRTFAIIQHYSPTQCATREKLFRQQFVNLYSVGISARDFRRFAQIIRRNAKDDVNRFVRLMV